MKGISKAAHAGLSPLIPAVLAPPEVMTQAPPGFIPPPLNPSGARLETQELAPGVYGLLSSKLPVDNSGFVVGAHGVLVIDAHINGAMAGRIQTAVRQITNKPILYVVRLFAIGLDHHIVAQSGADTIEVARFMGRGDPLPIAISGGHFGYEDW